MFTLLSAFFEFSPERFKQPAVIVGLTLMVLGLALTFGATAFSNAIDKKIASREKTKKTEENGAEKNSEIVENNLKTDNESAQKNETVLKNDAISGENDAISVENGAKTHVFYAENTEKIGKSPENLTENEAKIAENNAFSEENEKKAAENERLLKEFSEGEPDIKSKKSRYNFGKFEAVFKICGFVVVIVGALTAVLSL